MTLYVQVVVPLIMFLAYFLLGRPGSIIPSEDKHLRSGGQSPVVYEEDEDKQSELLPGLLFT